MNKTAWSSQALWCPSGLHSRTDRTVPLSWRLNETPGSFSLQHQAQVSLQFGEGFTCLARGADCWKGQGRRMGATFCNPHLIVGRCPEAITCTFTPPVTAADDIIIVDDHTHLYPYHHGYLGYHRLGDVFIFAWDEDLDDAVDWLEMGQEIDFKTVLRNRLEPYQHLPPEEATYLACLASAIRSPQLPHKTRWLAAEREGYCLVHQSYRASLALNKFDAYAAWDILRSIMVCMDEQGNLPAERGPDNERLGETTPEGLPLAVLINFSHNKDLETLEWASKRLFRCYENFFPKANPTSAIALDCQALIKIAKVLEDEQQVHLWTERAHGLPAPVAPQWQQHPEHSFHNPLAAAEALLALQDAS